MGYIAFAVAVGICVLIRQTGKRDTKIGRFCRWYWNTCMSIGANFPVLGKINAWLVIDDDDLKYRIEKRADEVNKMTDAYLERKIEENKHEQQLIETRNLLSSRIGMRVEHYDEETKTAILENGNRIDVSKYLD